MSSILNNALSYTQQGISVIPSDPKTKLPYWHRLPRIPHPTQPGKTKATWKPYMKKIASMNRLQQWFQDGCLNITVVCGQVSGGLVVFDFDYEADVIFPRWCQDIGALSAALAVARSFKGYHVYFRVAGYRPLPTQKVAFNETGHLLIEIKGEGGVIQAPPSRHPTGCRYQWLLRSHLQIPVLTAGAYTHLLSTAQALDRRPKPQAPTMQERDTWRVVSLPEGEDRLLSRLNRYVEVSVANECVKLSKVMKGSRNDALNKAAFRLGRFVGAGLLAPDQVYQALLQACRENNYIQEDGIEAFKRTLASGLSKGMQDGDVAVEKIRLRMKKSG